MWALLVLLLLSNGVFSEKEIRFSNLECDMLDPSYATYKQCHLKMLGRGIVGLNIHAILKKGAFNNAKVNLSLWRKYNGFQPFLFNTTFDFCKFMAKPKRKLSFQAIVVDAMASKSNLNHSCPYGHDIIVQEMVLKQDHMKFLPVPSGEYKIQIMAATNNEWKTIIKVYLSQKEDLITA